MKVTLQPVDPSAYAVPVGSYVTTLTGIKPMEPSEAHPDWGPSYAWEFTVDEGEQKGKIASCFTKQTATVANNLGKLLLQLTAGKLSPNDEIDLASFLHKRFQVMVGWNKDGTKTRVQSVMPLPGVAANGSPVAAPAPAPAPAVRPPVRPPAGRAVAGRKFFVIVSDAEGAPAELMEEAALLTWMTAHARDGDTVTVCQEGTDHSDVKNWKTAKEFGVFLPF